MAKAQRFLAGRMSDEHRDKIAKSKVLQVLIDHAEGRAEMSATRVQAGIALLRKYLPDVSAVTVSGDPDNPIPLAIRVQYEDPKG